MNTSKLDIFPSTCHCDEHMKAFLFCLVFSLGSLMAGEGVLSVTSSSVAPRTIPREVVEGIQKKAVYDFPNQPEQQVEAVTEGIEAYFEWRKIPANPKKTWAAEQFPFNFPKQLYLAMRGV